MTAIDLATGAASDLSKRVDSAQVHRPNGAPLLWNAAVDHRPALIVRARAPRGVQEAIRVARERGMRLSVLGAGYDWAGRGLCDGGLVINMSRMRWVTVDARTQVATVGGGATAGDVMAAAGRYGLVAAAGNVGAVGMTGLTLGGGYGPLNGRFGLASDKMLGAEVVLADGRIVTADATHEPELFWALRGGGGNFGVVTSMRVRLHPLNRLIGGRIVFPWSQAATVWRGLGEVLATAPDELTVQSGLLPSYDGNPTAYLAPTWSGDFVVGERVLDTLAKLGTPMATQVASMTYAEMLGLFDSYTVSGLHWAIRTRTIAGYTADVIDALVEAGRTRSSPLSGLPIHHFHGASTRIAADETAFANRREHFVVEIVAGWQPGDGAAHRAWADAVSTALAPHALPGGYAGLLGPDTHHQISNAYGDNAMRLLTAKTHYDPEGIFTAIPLPVNRRAHNAN